MKKLYFPLLLTATAVMCAVPMSLQLARQGELSLSLDKAHADIGRPLTPGRIAGVNRRMERRAARRAYHGIASDASAYDSTYGYGYGLAGAGLGAYAAATTSTYGGQGYGWNWDTKAYPPRAVYSTSYPPGSYFGPVCNPQVDNFCQ
jgi:hypothetical protein